ncbi:MAG: type I-C CRISPR-associated protein Cas5c [Peptococcaceae bacterium]|jgi:CRISPR-associated protein Cas5d|nr:type I-C CRISPR-associated protein Cas5c [Peptococcaceae bacterium]
MAYGFTVEIRGDYACFSRPELKVERVSYEVITPSAARGIMEAILWKPAIRYKIDEIAVCEPIRFENLRRSEVSGKIPHRSVQAAEQRLRAGKLYLDASDDRVQRASLILKKVRYVVTGHFEMTNKAGTQDNEGKFADMLRRRLAKGQNFYMPYLGSREFPANVRPIADDEASPEPIGDSRSLGLMLYDIDYITETDSDGSSVVTEFRPAYFMAEMRNGVIDLRNAEVLR